MKLVNEQGYSVGDAARSLGIDPANMRGWLEKFAADETTTPKGEGALAAE